MESGKRKGDSESRRGSLISKDGVKWCLSVAREKKLRLGREKESTSLFVERRLRHCFSAGCRQVDTFEIKQGYENLWWEKGRVRKDGAWRKVGNHW